MRKLKIVCVFLSFALVLCGCKQDCPYEKYVSNLQRDIYYGNINGINISATYGFREYPFINDGVAGTRVYGYVFKVDIIPDDIHRSIELESDGKTYAATFETDKVSGEYKAVIEINEYFEKTFNATFICGSEKNSVVFNSILPENCLTYEQTLQTLISEQSSLLNAYSNGEFFNAEIYMRVFVRNDAPYWYIGIASGNDKLKAFLIDGVSGKLIAVRDIF